MIAEPKTLTHGGILLLVLVLLIISAGARYWYATDDNQVQIGLFEVCSNGSGCRDLLDAMDGRGRCFSRFQAAQAFLVMAILATGAMLILLLLRIFVDAVKRIPILIDFIGAMVIAFCLTIPWPIAVDMKSACICTTGCHLHVSFAFALISWFIMLCFPVFLWFVYGGTSILSVRSPAVVHNTQSTTTTTTTHSHEAHTHTTHEATSQSSNHHPA